MKKEERKTVKDEQEEDEGKMRKGNEKFGKGQGQDGRETRA